MLPFSTRSWMEEMRSRGTHSSIPLQITVAAELPVVISYPVTSQASATTLAEARKSASMAVAASSRISALVPSIECYDEKLVFPNQEEI
jgi:hypothetical protein